MDSSPEFYNNERWMGTVCVRVCVLCVCFVCLSLCLCDRFRETGTKIAKE